jgi:hypothetical protein
VSQETIHLTCPCGGRVFCRAKDSVPTRCSFCQSALTRSTAPPERTSVEPPPGPPVETTVTPPAPVRRRLFVAEIVCLLCGRDTGTALSEQWPPTGPILFQPPDARTPVVVRAWWRVRCAVCGGNTAASEVTTRTVRLEPAIDWREEKPRRGSPFFI